MVISFKIDSSIYLSLLSSFSHTRGALCLRDKREIRETDRKRKEKRTLSPNRRNNRGIHLPTAGLKDASSH